MLATLHAVGGPTVPLLFMFLVCVCVSAWLIVVPARRLKQVFEHLRVALGLVAVKPQASLQASVRTLAVYFAWRPLPGLASFYLGRGERGDWTVELTLQLAAKAYPDVTTASVQGLAPAFEGIGSDRTEGRQRLVDAHAFEHVRPWPTWRMSCVVRTPDRARSSRAALFLEALAQFPRELLRIEIDSRCISVSWRGLETEPGIIEHGFHMNIAALIARVAPSAG